MKAIFTFIAIFTTTLLFSQDQRLFDHTWYLTNLNLSGADYPLPNNSEIQNTPLIFDQENAMLSTQACNYFGGDIVYVSGQDIFSLQSFYATQAFCVLTENESFEYDYYSFFWSAQVTPTFSYSIVNNGDNNLTLTLTAANGDLAIYGNQLLATANFNNSEFHIFPNPAQDFLYIHFNTAMFANGDIEIYDAMGKLSVTQRIDKLQTQVNIQDLTKGIYFIRVRSDNQTIVRKYIKN